MGRRLIQLAAVFIITLLIPVQQPLADVYAWTDENGIRHYSNIAPPKNGEITRLEESIQKLPSGARFKVTKIYDGDTIQAKGAGLTFKVRLVGIDSPEKGRKDKPGQPFSQKAKQALSKLVAGRQIRMKQYGTGGYNRVLAEIYADAGNINIELLKKGLAEVYRGKLPAGLNVGAYKRAESTAKAKRIGIWSLGARYKSPKQWRKENPWK